MDHVSPFVKDVDETAFATEVLQRSREVPVVVDFWAAWCGPCRTLGPLLERLAAEYDGAFELAKIDVDANPRLAQQFGVQGIPTVVAIRDGREVSRFTGAYPEPALRQWLDELVPSELDRMVDEARAALIAGDTVGAEHMLRQALESQPDHPAAATALASILIDRGDLDEAEAVLAKLPRDSEVERLLAAVRLRRSAGEDLGELERRVREHPDDDTAKIELAKALAARGQYEPALDLLIDVVRAKGEHKDEARLAVIDIFNTLGEEHPLTRTYRKALASALF